MVSAPFLREYNYYDGCFLPVSRSANEAGISVPGTKEHGSVSSPTDHDLSVESNMPGHYAARYQEGGFPSPHKGKAVEGGFLRSIFRDENIAGSELPKKDSYRASIAGAVSIVPVVVGKTSSVVAKSIVFIADANVAGVNTTAMNSDLQRFDPPCSISVRPEIGNRSRYSHHDIGILELEHPTILAGMGIAQVGSKRNLRSEKASSSRESASAGVSGILINGYPDPLEGRLESRFAGTVGSMGSSVPATDGEFDSLTGIVSSGSRGDRPVPSWHGRGIMGMVLPPLRADLVTAAPPDLERSDSDVKRLPGIVMLKSWVRDHVFQSIPSPATGYLGLSSNGSPIGSPVINFGVWMLGSHGSGGVLVTISFRKDDRVQSIQKMGL